MNTKLFMVALFTLLAFTFSNAQSQELDKKLIEACKIGDVGGVATRIKEGANVNAKNNLDKSIIDVAKYKGQPEIIQVLKEAGAQD
jgi:ankyrin repeat protein